MIDYKIINAFLDPGECATLIDLAKPKLQQATGVNPDGSVGVGSYRTSNMAWFTRKENAFIEGIERRIASITDMPIDNGEGLQVLHYAKGGEYRPHYDFFTPEGLKVHGGIAGQRVATVIMYLNTPEAGGATYFPVDNIQIEPITGRALLFWNIIDKQLLGDPTRIIPNRNTLHAGLPVLQGEKWIATKWLRERPF